MDNYFACMRTFFVVVTTADGYYHFNVLRLILKWKENIVNSCHNVLFSHRKRSKFITKIKHFAHDNQPWVYFWILRLLEFKLDELVKMPNLTCDHELSHWLFRVEGTVTTWCDDAFTDSQPRKPKPSICEVNLFTWTSGKLPDWKTNGCVINTSDVNNLYWC